MNKNVLSLFLLTGIFLVSCTGKKENSSNIINQITVDTNDMTLDFYDNAPVYDLKGSTEIDVSGEVEKTYHINFNDLPLRSVIVKEMIYDNAGKDSFVGAYRYDGYAIDDIINHIKIKKNPSNTLSTNIDLYLVISNDKGDSAVISWGEIFYPVHRHEIIIATKVMRIVPSKTKDLWPLPTETKIVVASDLITVRNINNPSHIAIHSVPFDESTGGKKGDTAFVNQFIIYDNNKIVTAISSLPENYELHTYPTVFYGRGRGIHSVTPFNGIMLKDILQKYFTVNKNFLQHSLLLAAGNDGYRAAFSFSEIMNRNDQAEILLVELDKNTPDGGGKFRLFPAADFFSDRSVKSLSFLKYFK